MFPTTMCFTYPKRFLQLPRRKQRTNTRKHTELYKNNSQPLFISSTKDYTIRVCVLCTKITCYTAKTLQPIYRQICELQGSPMTPIFQDIVGHFLPHDLYDPSSLESTLVMLPHSALRMLPLHLSSAPMKLPLHPCSGNPTASCCCFSC